MGRPLFLEIADRPATSAVICFCTCVWIFLAQKRLGYEDVGMSFQKVVDEGQYWRLIVSQLCHIEILHLVFNMTALWSLGFVETLPAMGTAYYLKSSLALLLCSEVVCLGFYYFMIKVLKREHYMRVTAVGYSCVVFGWMANLSVNPAKVGNLSLFGLASLPMPLAPFASLIVTSILIPRASFLGHLSGIVVGYLVGFGLFDWLSPFWAASLFIWVVLLVVVGLVKQRIIKLPFVRLEDEPDVETGGGVRIVNGSVVR